MFIAGTPIGASHPNGADEIVLSQKDAAAMRARAKFLSASIHAAEGPTRWARDPHVVAYAAGRVDAWRAEFEDLCERLRFAS